VGLLKLNPPQEGRDIRPHINSSIACLKQ